MNAFRRIVILGTLIMAFWSFSAYAAIGQEEAESLEEMTLESLAEQFDIRVADLEYRAPIYRPILDDYEMSSVVKYAEDEVVEEDYSQFADFSLSSGFEALDNTTFACEKTLVGQGLDGMVVGVAVYTKDFVTTVGQDDRTVYETVYNLGYSSVKELGASGLYNEVICFEDNSVQYVSVMVKQGEALPVVRTFRVTTLESITKTILENIEISFIIEEELVEEEPMIDSFMNWFGIDQEIEF